MKKRLEQEILHEGKDLNTEIIKLLKQTANHLMRDAEKPSKYSKFTKR